MNPAISQFDSLLAFLDRLRSSKIHHSLASYRQDAIMVHVTVPGERWEVEFLREGAIEVERFCSDGTIQSGSALEELFRKFSD